MLHKIQLKQEPLKKRTWQQAQEVMTMLKKYVSVSATGIIDTVSSTVLSVIKIRNIINNEIAIDNELTSIN